MPINTINPYEYDKFIASLYHFQPQDSFFQANPNVRQKAFDDLNLKGVGKYDGKNWSIRPAGHDLTDKEWNIIHIKLKDGQWGWNEHGVLIVNKINNKSFFTSYSNNQQQEVKELQRILEKYNLNEKDVQIISPNINPWKGGHDLSYSTSYLTFFIEQLIQNLENSNELGDFTNLNYKHKERANELHKGFFSNFTNSIWVNSMNRWNYYQSLVKGTEEGKNNVNPNQVQEVKEVHQQARSEEKAKTENQYLEEYNNLPLPIIIEMETYAGWCPTGSHTEMDDKTDKELIKLFRIYAVKIYNNEDYQEVKRKLLSKVPKDPWSHIKNDIIAKRVKLWRDKREVDGGIDWKWRMRNVEPFYEEVKKKLIEKNNSSPQEELNKAKAELNELDDEIERLENELATLGKQLKQAQRDNNSEKVKELEAKITENKKQLEESEKKQAELRMQIGKLQDELRKSPQKDNNDELNRLVAKNTELTLDWKKEKERADSSTRELEDLKKTFNSPSNLPNITEKTKDFLNSYLSIMKKDEENWSEIIATEKDEVKKQEYQKEQQELIAQIEQIKLLINK